MAESENSTGSFKDSEGQWGSDKDKSENYGEKPQSSEVEPENFEGEGSENSGEEPDISGVECRNDEDKSENFREESQSSKVEPENFEGEGSENSGEEPDISGVECRNDEDKSENFREEPQSSEVEPENFEGEGSENFGEKPYSSEVESEDFEEESGSDEEKSENFGEEPQSSEAEFEGCKRESNQEDSPQCLNTNELENRGISVQPSESNDHKENQKRQVNDAHDNSQNNSNDKREWKKMDIRRYFSAGSVSGNPENKHDNLKEKSEDGSSKRQLNRVHDNNENISNGKKNLKSKRKKIDLGGKAQNPEDKSNDDIRTYFPAVSESENPENKHDKFKEKSENGNGKRKLSHVYDNNENISNGKKNLKSKRKKIDLGGKAQNPEDKPDDSEKKFEKNFLGRSVQEVSIQMLDAAKLKHFRIDTAKFSGSIHDRGRAISQKIILAYHEDEIKKYIKQAGSKKSKGQHSKEEELSLTVINHLDVYKKRIKEWKGKHFIAVSYSRKRGFTSAMERVLSEKPKENIFEEPDEETKEEIFEERTNNISEELKASSCEEPEEKTKENIFEEHDEEAKEEIFEERKNSISEELKANSCEEPEEKTKENIFEESDEEAKEEIFEERKNSISEELKANSCEEPDEKTKENIFEEPDEQAKEEIFEERKNSISEELKTNNCKEPEEKTNIILKEIKDKMLEESEENEVKEPGEQVSHHSIIFYFREDPENGKIYIMTATTDKAYLVVRRYADRTFPFKIAEKVADPNKIIGLVRHNLLGDGVKEELSGSPFLKLRMISKPYYLIDHLICKIKKESFLSELFSDEEFSIKFTFSGILRGKTRIKSERIPSFLDLLSKHAERETASQKDGCEETKNDAFKFLYFLQRIGFSFKDPYNKLRTELDICLAETIFYQTLRGPESNSDQNLKGQESTSDQNLEGNVSTTDQNQRGQESTSDQNLKGQESTSDQNQEGKVSTSDQSQEGKESTSDQNQKGKESTSDQNQEGQESVSGQNWQRQNLPFRLRHSCLAEFLTSNNFEISFGTKNVRIEQEQTPPQINDIVTIINENNKESFKNKILTGVLKFTDNNNMPHDGKLINLIEGKVHLDGKPYFKVRSEWYQIREECLYLLHRDFQNLLQRTLIREGETGWLPLPWTGEITDREETYNRLYADDEHIKKGYLVFDQILPLFIEPCDILWYTTSTVYLYHVKKPFNRDTRVVCSQIFNAASLIRDALSSQESHNYLQKLYDTCVKKKVDGEDSWFMKVQEKVNSFSVEEFLDIFRKRNIVFVYAYLRRPDKSLFHDIEKLYGVTCDDLGGGDMGERLLDTLKSLKYVDDDGRLQNKSYFTNKEHHLVKGDFKGKVSEEEMEIIIRALKAARSSSDSTIAKVEVVHVAENLRSWGFDFKMCEIKLLNETPNLN